MFKTPAFHVAVSRVISFLKEIAPVCEVRAGLPAGSLTVPEGLSCSDDDTSIKLIKEFCVGLLENPVDHTWWPALRRAPLDVRVSIAGSLFLVRKMLPSPPAPWEAHFNRVCRDPASVPNGYLRHVTKVVEKIFPVGWDHGYARVVSSYTPPTSSCLEATTSQGGSRGRWHRGQSRFIQIASGISDPPETEFIARFMNVDCGGKSRSVTVASSDQCLLGPMHRLIYGQLDRNCEWLLRGEAKPCKFRNFQKAGSEVFVSGDYQSATDNLPLEVAECILGVLERRARFIPSGVFSLARRSLRATVEYPLGEHGACRFKQVRGQLMGNLLSFPLLCLQNYAAFRWCVNRQTVPDSLVRINGDDIVFRSSRQVASRWMDTVSSLGLVVSRGKTLVSSSFFSLNSTFFKVFPQRLPRLIPVVRSQCLATPNRELTPHALGPGLATFARGFRGEARVLLEMIYLRWRGRLFAASGRSLLRDLRAPVSAESLVRLGWAKREAWMLSSTPPTPLPPDEVRLGGSVPEGWVRVPRPAGSSRRGLEALNEEFGDLLIERAWNGDPVPKKRLLRNVWNRTVASGWQSSFLWWRAKSRGRFGCGVQSTWSITTGFPMSRSSPAVRRLAGAFRQPLSPLFEYSAPRRVPKVWLRREEVPCHRGLGFV